MGIRLYKTILLLSLLSVAIASIQLSNRRTVLLSQKTDNSYEKSKLLIAKTMPSLGFGNVLSNAYFLKFLKYFGDDEQRKTDGYSLSADILSISLNYDPYYRSLYFFLSESTTVYAGTPEKTVSIIEKELSQIGEDRPSDSFYIWRYKGMDELLFLNRGADAETSFRRAAEWAENSDHPDSEILARLSSKTAEFLASNPDSKLARFSSWVSVLASTSDKNIKERAVQEIEKLGGKVSMDEEGRTQVQPPVEDFKVKEGY